MSGRTPVRLLSVCLLLLGLIFLAGCTDGLSIPGVESVTGSGNVITREFDFADFDRVSVGYAFKVNVTRGDDYAVVVRVDDNLEQYLKVEQNGQQLTIGMTDPLMLNRATLEVAITMPAISELEFSGATSGTVSGFSSSEPFSANASGASRMEGAIETGAINVTASGASTIRLSGAASGDAVLEASGASTIDMENFPVANANAKSSGASRVTVNTDGNLDAEASGASTVNYVGQPTMGNISETGGSSIGPK